MAAFPLRNVWIGAVLALVAFSILPMFASAEPGTAATQGYVQPEGSTQTKVGEGETATVEAGKSATEAAPKVDKEQEKPKCQSAQNPDSKLPKCTCPIVEFKYSTGGVGQCHSEVNKYCTKKLELCTNDAMKKIAAGGSVTPEETKPKNFYEKVKNWLSPKAEPANTNTGLQDAFSNSTKDQSRLGENGAPAYNDIRNIAGDTTASQVQRYGQTDFGAEARSPALQADLVSRGLVTPIDPVSLRPAAGTGYTVIPKTSGGIGAQPYSVYTNSGGDTFYQAQGEAPQALLPQYYDASPSLGTAPSAQQVSQYFTQPSFGGWQGVMASAGLQPAYSSPLAVSGASPSLGINADGNVVQYGADGSVRSVIDASLLSSPSQSRGSVLSMLSPSNTTLGLPALFQPTAGGQAVWGSFSQDEFSRLALLSGPGESGAPYPIYADQTGSPANTIRQIAALPVRDPYELTVSTRDILDRLAAGRPLSGAGGIAVVAGQETSGAQPMVETSGSQNAGGVVGQIKSAASTVYTGTTEVFHTVQAGVRTAWEAVINTVGIVIDNIPLF